jgi:hypothetical protein
MHWKAQIQVLKQKDVFKGLKLRAVEEAMSALTIDAHLSL